ncbi:hypothetical protein BST61_g3593 [Cercospora zeina]
MAASPHAGDSNSRDIFPFFDLPRELRDTIYELAVEDRNCGEGTSDQPKMTAVNVPLPHLLQISRQFSTEYRERAEVNSTLYLYDHIALQPNTPKLSTCVPIPARNIRTLHIRLASFAGEELSEEFELHEQWVKLAVHTVLGLQVLDLRIDVTTTEDAQRSPQQRLQGVQSVGHIICLIAAAGQLVSLPFAYTLDKILQQKYVRNTTSFRRSSW